MLRKLVLAGVICAVSGCGDPLAGVERIGDVELADSDAAAALPTDKEVAREGFFGTDAARGKPNVEPAPAPAEPGGFLGLFRRAPGDQQTDDVAETSADPQADETLVAALEPDAAAPVQPRQSGIFGARTVPGIANTGPDAQDVAYGTRLPFGEVARSCAAKGQPLGRKIEEAPARGYALHDTNPASAGMRTFYITGFSDGCPRQLTAATVLLGAASLYEQLHYGPAGEHLPVAETDRAYEKVKRRVCGAGRGRPCGSKIKKMERSTFFVSAYPGGGSSSRWTELLIHDGAVVAAALKSAR